MKIYYPNWSDMFSMSKQKLLQNYNFNAVFLNAFRLMARTFGIAFSS